MSSGHGALEGEHEVYTGLDYYTCEHVTGWLRHRIYARGEPARGRDPAGVYKDGERVGGLAYGTPDAVRGNIQAESEATIGSNLNTGGWLLQIGGVGAFVGAAGVSGGGDPDRHLNPVFF